MNDDIPEITIDDNDPIYLKFLEEQAEDRRRWAASPKAKAEMQKVCHATFPELPPQR